jgi:hypothetical protein
VAKGGQFRFSKLGQQFFTCYRISLLKEKFKQVLSPTANDTFQNYTLPSSFLSNNDFDAMLKKVVFQNVADEISSYRLRQIFTSCKRLIVST